MADTSNNRGDAPAAKPPVLSVHVLLPEAIDRRVERRTEKMLGASWPAWGGHVTILPSFLALSSFDEIRTAMERVCADFAPLNLRFGEAVAVPDVTRANYFAVLLTVEEVPTVEVAKAMPPLASGARLPEGDGAMPTQHEPDTVERAAPPPALQEDAAGTVEVEGRVPEGDRQMPLPPTHLVALRARLLDALAPMRQDLRPQLIEQSYAPHVTLALGLGEAEARTLVRHLRAEPILGEFTAGVIWLLTHVGGESPRVDRQPIPLGKLFAQKAAKG